MRPTKVLFITLIMLFSANAFSASSQEESLLINMLLNINSEQYVDQQTDGTTSYDSLREYQDWTQIYINNSNYDSNNKTLTAKQIKKLLFMAFISKTNNDAGLAEALSSDLVPIYNANKTLFLQSLHELDFLLPATCYYLGNYFGFEDKHKSEAKQFIADNKPLFQTVLSPTQVDSCLVELTKYDMH